MDAQQQLVDKLKPKEKLLLQCTSCQEVKIEQKLLPCQHGICLICVKKLTVQKNGTVKCPSLSACGKEHVVPNGGIANFPDHLMLKSVAEILLLKIPVQDTSHVKQEITVDVKELAKEIESAESWLNKTDHYSHINSKLLEMIDEGIQTSSETLKEFKEAINHTIEEKIVSLKLAKASHNEEMDEQLKAPEHALKEVREALNTTRGLKKKLRKNQLTVEDEAAIDVCLQKLKTNVANQYKVDYTIERGQPVMLSPSHQSENATELLANKVSYMSVGIFFGVVDVHTAFGVVSGHITQQVCAIFPEQIKWEGQLSDLIKTQKKPSIPTLQDRVQVKAKVTKPKYGWNGVQAAKSKGVLVWLGHKDQRFDNDLEVIVDFPECHRWKGLYTEIEKLPGCGLFAGDKVRVSRKISEPTNGWGGINASSVGTVKRIQGPPNEEEVTVDFPECSDWKAPLKEVEIAVTPQVDDFVQIKLTVSTPRLGWATGVSHQNIGKLTKIMQSDDHGDVARIKFPHCTKQFDCVMDEIEPARYHDEAKFDELVAYFDRLKLQSADEDDDDTFQREFFAAAVMFQRLFGGF